MNFLQRTKYHNIPEGSYTAIENNKDGNCLYESVLDAARHWLPVSHDLSRLFPGNVSRNRPKRHAVQLRQHLSFYLSLQLEEATSRTNMTEQRKVTK